MPKTIFFLDMSLFPNADILNESKAYVVNLIYGYNSCKN